MKWLLCIFVLLIPNVAFTPDEQLVLSGTTDESLAKYHLLSKKIIISTGTGGNLYGMIDYINTSSDVTIIIDGDCFSACTMLLNAPNVFFTENAEFYFHSSFQLKCDPKNVVLNPFANLTMLETFTVPIRKWVIKTNAYSSLSFTRLPKKLLMEEYGSKIISSSSFLPYERDRKEDVDFLPYGEKDISCER